MPDDLDSESTNAPQSASADADLTNPDQDQPAPDVAAPDALAPDALAPDAGPGVATADGPSDAPFGGSEPAPQPEPQTTDQAIVAASRPRRRAAGRPAGPPEFSAAEPTPAMPLASLPGPATEPAGEFAEAQREPDSLEFAGPVGDQAAAGGEPGPDREVGTAEDEDGQDAEAPPPPPLVVGLAPPAVLFRPPAPPPDELVDDETAGGPDLEGITVESVEPIGGAEPGRRRRRGRGRGRAEAEQSAPEADAEAAALGEDAAETAAEDGDEDGDGGEELAEGAPEAGEPDEEGAGTGGRRRRRRRRRRSTGEEPLEPAPDDPPATVVHVREPRDDSEVQGVKGSTRLHAKKQRRREGRELGRRKPPILTESEFLARRESVERVMVVRQRGDRTQIAVLEDGVLVEHFVERSPSSSLVGNVYLGRVQNVLPSMEAAFVDVGRGRNAVLYAGEVNYDASGIEGKPNRIEQALKPGQSVLVQVTKDAIGHKGARLTSQVSLPGRFVVYVPQGSMTGISRKLPDTERNRLKAILKDVLPEGAGVIVRTAAEGATEEDLARDVARLEAQWQDIAKKAGTATAPALLYGEPDLTVKVIRDIFNEDFTRLVVFGDREWDMVEAYVAHVAPDLVGRLERWTGEQDAFAAHRIDEQLAKALDRKVWLPSGGSLVIDRTEAMTVIDVNTGRFTGQGGNLEETVTRNNLEAAEELVRQLRLRDIGGIIVIDFIDMVLESNRDLVLRRLLECLGRDRTRHQVAEVTSLGLVQMTRKRVGGGLLELFSTPCECCNGRGLVVSTEPAGAAPAGRAGPEPVRRRRRAARDDGPRPEPPAAVATDVRPAREGVATAEGVEVEGPESEGPQPEGPEASGLEVEAPEASRPEVEVPEASGLEVEGPEAAEATQTPTEPSGDDSRQEPARPASRSRRARRAAGQPEEDGSPARA